MTTYVFYLVHAGGAKVELAERQLFDDRAAIDWMERELICPSDQLVAYRKGEPEPFASRVFTERAVQHSWLA